MLTIYWEIGSFSYQLTVPSTKVRGFESKFNSKREKVTVEKTFSSLIFIISLYPKL